MISTASEPVATVAGSRLAGLDGCRALAAIAVVVYHVTGRVGRSIDPRPLGLDIDAWMAPLGNYGVCVFFLLSGFLLYRPFVAAEFLGRPRPSLRRFYTRRLLRIYPAYWVAFIAVMMLSASTGAKRPVGLGGALAHVALVQRFLGRGLFEGLSVAWTLCIEVSFYAALPAIAWCISRLTGPRGASVSRQAGGQLFGLALLAALAWGYRFIPTGTGGLPPMSNLWLPNYLDWFAIGMVLAVAYSWREAGGVLPRWVRLLADRPWLSWLLALELYWVGVQLNVPVSLSVQPRFEQELGRFAVNGLSAGFFLLPCVLGVRESAALRVLGGRTLTAIGAISYGIYLWHAPLLNSLLELGAPRSFIPLFASTMAVTMLIASASYVLVERPAMSLSASRGVEAAPRLVAT